MYNRILNYIKENNMIEKKDKIIAGISGGADSVCLFFVLLELRKEYNLELIVVHVNHGIRGKAASEDAAYVESLCRNYKVDFELVETDIKKRMEGNGTTEEEEGRNVRYEAFYESLKKKGANKIAVAHNKNDQAETVLFHLFRGSGINGLTGIKPVREQIIRPLLCVSRLEIETYLKELGILYQTDESNFETYYTRNKLRLKVLPFVIREINVRAVEHIAESAVILKEVESYVKKNVINCYNRIVTKENGQYSFLVAEFEKEDIVIQKGILQLMIEQLAGKLKDITGEHMNMILSLVHKNVGKKVNLPYGITAVRTYQSIIVHRNKYDAIQLSKKNNYPEIFREKEIKLPGVYDIDQSELSIQVEILLMEDEINNNIPQNNYTKWFDYDKIKNTVLLRTRREGDFIQIDQKGSKKKLKAFFIDNKIPKENRSSIPLLADGSHIMWIIGSRISEAYKVNGNTKKILCVKLSGGKEYGTQD